MPYLATAFPFFCLRLKCEIKKIVSFFYPGFQKDNVNSSLLMAVYNKFSCWEKKGKEKGKKKQTKKRKHFQTIT